MKISTSALYEPQSKEISLPVSIIFPVSIGFLENIYDVAAMECTIETSLGITGGTGAQHASNTGALGQL